MKIHVYAICWNEEVLLPYFLRHYESMAEKIVIYDNISNDGSIQIINSHPLAHAIPYDTNHTIRDDVYLEIKNNAWKESRGVADFVIVCDIDEFLYHTDLNAFLKKHRAEGYILFKTNGYLMVGSAIPTGDGMIYEEIDRGVPDKWSCKCALFDPEAVQEINYTPGSHGSSAIGNGKILTDPGLKLLHYKYLGLEYSLTRKEQLKKRLSQINKEKGWGKHFDCTDEYYTNFYKQLMAEAEKIL